MRCLGALPAPPDSISAAAEEDKLGEQAAGAGTMEAGGLEHNYLSVPRK